MTNDQVVVNLNNKIKQCFDVKGNISFRKISKDLLDDINKHTSFLDDYAPKTQERIYCILNNIKEVKLCPLTNTKLRFSPQTKSYSNSKKLAYSTRVIKNKPNHKLRNVGYIGDVIKIYSNSSYNLLTPDDCISIFHSLMPHKNSRISPAIAKNNIDFVCSIFFHTSFMDNFDLNISERVYCLKNNIKMCQTDDFGLKLKFINMNDGYSKFSSKQELYKHHLDNAKDIISEKFTVHDYIKEKDSGTTHRVNVTCKKCNYNFSPFFRNALWKYIYCPGCDGVVGRSRMENEMIEYLESLGIANIIKNDRSMLNGLELDIYLPDYGIAIEMCGVLWHSFGTGYPNTAYKEKSNKYNHKEKYDRCDKLKISLLTIFENEWNLKRDIVKSIISNKLGFSKNRIFARKCIYKEVTKQESSKFLENNHIQGNCSHSKSYGLYHNNELVSLMCFGKRKLTRGKSAHELIRFCNKLHTSVVGGASKILKNCKVGDFISYCDLRYSSGNIYHNLNMKLVKTSPPNYYYTIDKINLLHRMNFQKHKISNKGDTRTEWEIMYDKGYRRIYDCGNLVFEYINTK